MTDLATVHSEETQKSQVDTETTERFIAEKHIGERIKRLRLKKSMGLVELGRHTGLSASFLSQLETGRVVPTLRNLARIAMVFSKALPLTLEDAAGSAVVGSEQVDVFPWPHNRQRETADVVHHAVVVEEGVVEAGHGQRGVADDLAVVVDVRGEGRRPAQGAQVGDRGVRVPPDGAVVVEEVGRVAHHDHSPSGEIEEQR